MNNFKIAWRNLWRNSRRTIITAASVFFGVIFSAVMTSMQYGSYGSMIDNVVKFYSGYMQVFTEDYHENKTINNTFEYTDQLVNLIDDTEGITDYSSRLEYFALASSEELTKGTIIIGADPQAEDRVTNVSKWVVEGKYLEQGDEGVLVAIDLANYLKIKVNDTLVLLGQGYHGVMAAGKFPVRGILRFQLPELNKQMVYMDLHTCQEFFSADNRLTSLVLMVEDHNHLSEARRHLEPNITSPYMLQSWDEMQPELVSMIEADRAGGVFTKAILYMIITFGIFGTMMMMVSERMRELGVMIAIGMQRYRLAVILFMETCFIGLLGAIAGIAGSIPIIIYYVNNPIQLSGDAAKAMTDMGIEPLMYFSMDPEVFYNQAIIVFIITMVVGAYPVYKAFKIKVNTALRA